ncbi:hypothetical protein LSCM1_06446 [Leishmania martiniquensis]|uniref:Uncharacterized protein n=1 Tax=Leishmania martiniquensis TaxID=1580590 RepID=A0A836HNG3_9TRYP|nr:hypothetical protein LSCM1_06446 [Leishmania martiniquensis]
MLGNPLSKSNSGEMGRGGGYEFGEYDGVMDVESILQSTAGASPNLAGSPTVVDGDIGVYGNQVSLPSDNRNGSAPTPLGRGAPRKPTRMSAGSTCSGDGHSIRVSTTAAAPRYPVAVAGKTPDGAAASTAGRRTNSLYLSAEADAHDTGTLSTRQGTRKPTYLDDVVHLPAIGIQPQMRKKVGDAFPSRARAALSAPDPSTSTISAVISHGSARSSGVGAKSIPSAGNLESLQPPIDSCGATSSTQYNGSAVLGPHRPPYHAAPLSPLRTKGRHCTNDTKGTGAASKITNGGSVGASLQDVSTRNRSAIDGAVKRGESVEAGEGGHMNGHCSRAATHSTAGSGDVVTTSKTNGWVKEEARRLDQRACTSSSTAPSQFPRERMKSKLCGGSSSPNAGSRPSARGHNDSEEGATCTKLNTSPAPVTPKAHVWAGDYEMAGTPGIGLTNFSIVAMPKVCPSRPLAGGLKASAAAEGGSSNNRSSVKSPAQTLHHPPSEATAVSSVNGVASPTESAITPLRKVFARSLKPASSTNGAAAQAAPNARPIPHVPLTNLPTSPAMDTTAAPNSSSTAPQSAAASSPPVASAPGYSVAAVKSDKSLSAPHTPTLSHRSMMSVVDTSKHLHAHGSSARQQGPLTSGPSGMPQLHEAQMSEMGLPYSDERRAALEAWADVPVLTVNIRGQSLTPTQRARESAKTHARPSAARQMYAPVHGQGRQQVAGEPCDLNYEVHNVVVQLRHRNRPLMMHYPPRLPLEVDMRPRMRRQRTPRSFYGNSSPHVGDAWFKDALNDARTVDSPDIESMEKYEEAEFIRNGGDPATRRNRYGQANNAHAHQQQHQRPPQRGNVGAAEVGTAVDATNRNPIRMEQPAS